MKFKYIIFGILINMIIINVSAAKLEIGIDGETSINEKDSATINAVLKLDDEEEKIESISFDLNYDTELLKISGTDSQYVFAKNGNSFVISKKEDFTNGNIVAINITNISSEEDTITTELKIKNAKLKYKDDNNEEKIVEIKDDDIKPLNLTLKKMITTTTRALNTSAELTNFKVNNNATVKPAFSKDIKEYKIYVKDTLKQVTITPQYLETGVQLEVECLLGCTPDTSAPNKINVIQGKNEAKFTFISEDGKTKNEYKFIIYRGPTTDGSNLLADLKLDGEYKLNEKFDKSNLDYTVTVPYTIEKLNVLATAEDSNADVSIKGNEKLIVGENVITITVTSTETMEKKIYNITVTREEFVPEEENTTVVTPTIEKEATPPKSNNNTKLLIIIGGISTLIIIIAAYFIFFFKGKKKKQNLELTVPELPKIVHPNELIDEDKEPTTVDDALKDLMQTRNIAGIKEDDDKPTF